MSLQLDLFAAPAPIRIQPEPRVDIVAQVMRQAEEQKGWKQRPRYRTVLFGSIYDRITEPVRPASDIDDWPPLIYFHCAADPHQARTAMEHGGYQDRRRA